MFIVYTFKIFAIFGRRPLYSAPVGIIHRLHQLEELPDRPAIEDTGERKSFPRLRIRN